MSTAGTAPGTRRLSSALDALTRRLFGPVNRATPQAEETWLGWDAWVRIAVHTGDPRRR